MSFRRRNSNKPNLQSSNLFMKVLNILKLIYNHLQKYMGIGSYQSSEISKSGDENADNSFFR